MSYNISEKKQSLNGKRFFSIKYKMMGIFGVLTTIALIILTIVSITIAKKSVMEKVDKQLTEKAEDMANLIETSLEGNFAYIQTIGRTLIQDTSLSYLERAILLEKEAATSGMLAIYVADNNGVLHLADGTTIDVSDRKYFKMGMKGKSHITVPYEDRVTGDLIIDITSPVYDQNNNILGVIILSFDGLELNKYIDGIVVGKTGECEILSVDGTLIATSDPELVKSKTNFINLSKEQPVFENLAEFQYRAITSKTSSIGFYTYKGVRKIAAFSKIVSTGWTVIVYAPEQEFLDTVAKLQTFIIIINTIIVFIVLIIGSIFSNRIATPIAKVSTALKEISGGNLNTEVDELNLNDEIGILSSSLFTMVEKLRSIVSEINENSDNLSGMSNQVNDTSQQLASVADMQASSTANVSATIAEMQDNISQNTDNSKNTAQIAAKSQKEIINVKEQAEKSTEASDLINDRIAVVNEIAMQTNILALNAAIEAARAGKHGKGFAVVATEIRKLAERSKEAAEEVVALTQNGKMVADKAGESLRLIIPYVEQTAILVKEITTASVEQNFGAEQINNAIQQLNQIAQQNATTSRELSVTSEAMTAQAKRLKNLVSYFKIN